MQHLLDLLLTTWLYYIFNFTGLRTFMVSWRVTGCATATSSSVWRTSSLPTPTFSTRKFPTWKRGSPTSSGWPEWTSRARAKRLSRYLKRPREYPPTHPRTSQLDSRPLTSSRYLMSRLQRKCRWLILLSKGVPSSKLSQKVWGLLANRTYCQ